MAYKIEFTPDELRVLHDLIENGEFPEDENDIDLLLIMWTKLKLYFMRSPIKNK